MSVREKIKKILKDVVWVNENEFRFGYWKRLSDKQIESLPIKVREEVYNDFDGDGTRRLYSYVVT